MRLRKWGSKAMRNLSSNLSMTHQLIAITCRGKRIFKAVLGFATKAATSLLALPSPARLLAVINVGAEKGINPWNLLVPLLNHSDDGVRRLVAFYAVVRSKTRALLLKILGSYLAQSTYFYDVVSIFDLAIYAPARVRHLRLNEIFGRDSDVMKTLQGVASDSKENLSIAQISGVTRMGP